MSQYLHFNNIIHRLNKNDGGTRQVISHRCSRHAKATLCQEIRWPGGRFVYDPAHPLPCGAVAYIELDDDVVVELVQPARFNDVAHSMEPQCLTTKKQLKSKST